MSRLLKPNEPAQPQRIKQLEEQLQSAYISERQAIAKELVEAHGGRIIIDSKVNEGTEVRIELPFVTKLKNTEPG